MSEQVKHTPLEHDPRIPTSIWRDGSWVASTNCESGGTIQRRKELAADLVARYNAHDTLTQQVEQLDRALTMACNHLVDRERAKAYYLQKALEATK
jgi:hypothetical protein